MSLRHRLVNRHFLDARVILLDPSNVSPILKVPADSLCFVKSGTIFRPHSGSVLRSLEYLQVQAGSGVRGDVAVHEPTTGIVGLKGDDDVCAAMGHDDISSSRVVAAKVLIFRTCTLDVVWAEALIRLVDDGKIMAMEMNLEIGERLRAPRWLTAGMSDLRDGRLRPR